jgi:hypothetical protein
MASKNSRTPWHKVVELRDDLRSGQLTLATFAADLYDVVMGTAKPIYQRPEEFFALTYPTFNLRELVKDVLLRLAGKNDRAVRQLELTYGGGKTHALITLYHLVSAPERLPKLPAVQEFRQHAGGVALPKARVAVLPFDKLDVEKGMEVRSPAGERRWLVQPWSVLAFQVAGSEGLRLLHAQRKDQERESPPAENLLRELLALPAKDNLATLVLIDEVLTYAREKVGLDPQWRHRLQDFFQYLTQAVTMVDRACVVASLLATDPRKSDELGKEISQELYAIFHRKAEKGSEPVEKQDVAEILRRRFFTTESTQNREAFRSQVMTVLDGIQTLDEWTHKNRKAEEERYLASYPFHPDLTEALYSKWTQLEGFQRTRGVLRTFALALRDAERWDTSPLVGANVLLNAPEKAGLSEALKELASVASYEEYEGKRQDWPGILQGELEKARNVQQELPALSNREIEQAVIATFLHSQPIGQKALTRELLVLLGAAKPDKIELGKGLRRWAEISWFLDESALYEAGGAELTELPKTWRLGSKPNLKQMHSQAVTRVLPDLVDMKLMEFIAKEKSLTAGGPQAGVRVHNLPQRPREVQDDGDFHYVVLGPAAASEIGKPSNEARRFIKETTSPERPRTYQNAILLLVPSVEGLELLRNRVRDYLGWEEVNNLPETKGFDELHKALLKGYTEEARRRIPDAVVQAYNVVVTVSARGEIEAFRITPGDEPLFETIKKDKRSRIQESAISPEALLPEGPYDLWKKGEKSRRANDLVRAFAQFPHLPKMLRRKDIEDTLALGTAQGHFVLRVTRPDRSIRTVWRAQPTDVDFQERDVEVVLPEAAELENIDCSLLSPGALPGLWPEKAPSITVADVIGFFDGKHLVKVKREGYEESLTVPRAPREVVEKAVDEAVRSGRLWFISGALSLFRESIPPGLLSDAAMLNPPPSEIGPMALLPQNLAAAWRQPVTTAAELSQALSAPQGKPLPWSVVRNAIDAAIRGRLPELAEDSGVWPCDWLGAANIRLKVPKEVVAAGEAPGRPQPRGPRCAQAELKPAELQDFVEGLSNVLTAGAGLNLRFVLRLELGDGAEPTAVQLARLNEALAKICAKLQFS